MFLVHDIEACQSHEFKYLMKSLQSIEMLLILQTFDIAKHFSVISCVRRQHFCWRTPLWGKYFRNEAPNSWGITESLIYSIEHDKETYRVLNRIGRRRFCQLLQYRWPDFQFLFRWCSLVYADCVPFIIFVSDDWKRVFWPHEKTVIFTMFW